MQILQSNRASQRSAEAMSNKLKGKVLESIPLQSLNVEIVDPALLKPNPYNPNKQNDDEFALLRQSIKSDGFTMPVLVNKDLMIIDGEHRWRAALAEGLKLIPVVKLDLNDARMKMATIRHNKATGSHDMGLEALVLKDLEILMGVEFIREQLHVGEEELREILNFTNAPDMLAGDEFGQSWSPVKNDSVFDSDENGNPQAGSTFKIRKTVDSALVMRSATENANTLAYKKIVKKDKEAGMQHLYTMTAVFNPEEAVYVQKVLEDPALKGETPAEKLFWLAKGQEEII